MEVQQTASKKSDGKVIILFTAMALAILVVLLGLGVSVYYLSKNSDFVNKVKTELAKSESDPETGAIVQEEVTTVTPTPQPTAKPKTPIVQRTCYKYTVYEGPFKALNAIPKLIMRLLVTTLASIPARNFPKSRLKAL